MSTVEELIGDLLLRHNCVVIPSFGGFVAKKTSATIDYKNGVIYPPKKSVLFNRQLINNDGLLVAEYSTVNKVDYTEAELAISQITLDWNTKLRNGERITLDKVGYLFFDQEKNLCFEQDRFFNLLLESYGLGKVHFVSEEDIEVAKYVKAVQEQKKVEEEEKSADSEPFKLVALPTDLEEKEPQPVIIEHPQSRNWNKAWRYVAAAMLAPIAFYSFWIPMNSNVLESGVLSVKDFDLSYNSTDGKYLPEDVKLSSFEVKDIKPIGEVVESLPNDVYIYSYAFDEDTYISVKVKEGNEPQALIQEEEIIEPEVIVETPIEVKKAEAPKSISKPVVKEKKKVEEIAKLNFIVGSFSTKENAETLIEKMNTEGFKAYIMSETNGAFRVSAGKAKTEEEIRKISKKAKEKGFDGWILR
jgi:cell division septation protein DedD